MTVSEAIIECTALRDRPNPEFIRARPAYANGINRIRSPQETAAVSGKTLGGIA